MSASTRDWAQVKTAKRAKDTINPIRNLVQNIDVVPNPSLTKIDLSVGDPTVYGNLQPPAIVQQKLSELVLAGTSNGYPQSMGTMEARKAVAEFFSNRPGTGPNNKSPKLDLQDVFLTPGGSGAMELALSVIADPGDNILIPQPGFPLFRTQAGTLGIECKRYKIVPERDWEIDLESVRAAVDERTRAIILNNPSNPCGSVWKREHVADILKLAAELKLVVISDEIYADMVFSGNEFCSAADQAQHYQVPVLTLGGISKRFVVPGWRLGWVLTYDQMGILEKAGVRKGLNQLTTRMLIPSRLIQAVLPIMLDEKTQDSHDSFVKLMQELELNAQVCYDELSKCPGLVPVRPRGSMYLMVGIDVKRLGFQDDMEFTKTLFRDQAVFVLPGQCFEAPNFVRIVFSAPKYVLLEAFERIRQFCIARDTEKQ